MITSLFIKNFILIDELNIDFEGAFGAICGETGAGKSVILKALDTVSFSSSVRESLLSFVQDDKR